MSILWHNFGIPSMRKSIYRAISKFVILIVFVSISIAVSWLNIFKQSFKTQDLKYYLASYLTPITIATLNLMA
jgi:hypothetical protein